MITKGIPKRKRTWWDDWMDNVNKGLCGWCGKNPCKYPKETPEVCSYCFVNGFFTDISILFPDLFLCEEYHFEDRREKWLQNPDYVAELFYPQIIEMRRRVNGG